MITRLSVLVKDSTAENGDISQQWRGSVTVYGAAGEVALHFTCLDAALLGFKALSNSRALPLFATHRNFLL